MENTTDEDVVLKAGQRIVQGIVMPYVIPKNATSDEIKQMIAIHKAMKATNFDF